MRCAIIPITATLLSCVAHAATGGMESRERVNVVAETGADIGPCPGGGTLSYPPAPYKGSPYFLLRADATLATRHESLAKAQPPWLRRLEAPSGTNRLFTAANGDQALVFWSCKPGNCGGSVAYGAYGTRSTDYVLQVRDHGETASLGRASALLDTAIACARAHDDEARRRTTEALKKHTGQ